MLAPPHTGPHTVCQHTVTVATGHWLHHIERAARARLALRHCFGSSWRTAHTHKRALHTAHCTPCAARDCTCARAPCAVCAAHLHCAAHGTA
eukprot:10422794-Alexandrium_andersonii.AAC.1